MSQTKKILNAIVKFKHPPTPKMVETAIIELRDGKGCSVQAIKKYIATNYVCNISRIYPRVNKYLKRATENGNLIQVSGHGAVGTFRISQEKLRKLKEDVNKSKKLDGKRITTPNNTKSYLKKNAGRRGHKKETKIINVKDETVMKTKKTESILFKKLDDIQTSTPNRTKSYVKKNVGKSDEEKTKIPNVNDETMTKTKKNESLLFKKLDDIQTLTPNKTKSHVKKNVGKSNEEKTKIPNLKQNTVMRTKKLLDKKETLDKMSEALEKVKKINEATEKVTRVTKKQKESMEREKETVWSRKNVPAIEKARLIRSTTIGE